MSLQAYLTTHLNTPFEWGSNDCVLFAAGWVQQATGRDPLDGVPKWRSMREALRTLKNMGGMERVLDDRFPRIPVRSAKDGDLALYRGCICIFNGSNIVGPYYTGLVFTKRSNAEFAWSVK